MNFSSGAALSYNQLWMTEIKPFKGKIKAVLDTFGVIFALNRFLKIYFEKGVMKME